MKKKISISVRNLIEEVLKTGSINDRYISINRALEGTKAHQKVQESYGEDYEAEVSLNYKKEYENFIVELQGRVDGIFKRDPLILEEIKSTTWNLEDIKEDHNLHHWAQVKCYSYIVMEKENLEEIEIQLTYFQIESQETKSFNRLYNKKDLEEYFFNLLDTYVEKLDRKYNWKFKRDVSIEDLKFPFKDYRKGQRELAVASYETIIKGKKLYLQAPTGIGKTISLLFPSVKALPNLDRGKIFYLTGKTITREAPIKALDLMRENGAKLKSLIITAKDKICINDVVSCNKEKCPYAKGYYNRLDKALKDIFKEEEFSREIIIKYSKKHTICPYEFSLELSKWSDIIICDYNYLFDSNVRPIGVFEEGENIFLIDEAHNLLDRGREIFSAEIIYEEILEVLPEFEQGELSNSLEGVLKVLDNFEKEKNINREYYQEEKLEEVIVPLRRSINLLDRFLGKNPYEKEEVFQLYFNLRKFLKVYNLYDDSFLTSYEIKKNKKVLRLNCINPAKLIRENLNEGKSSILFSATLMPFKYYMELLGGKEEDYHMILESPFPKENLSISIVENLSTKYRDRAKTSSDLIKYIEVFTKVKKGNYLIFFPSYAYMEEIYKEFKDRNPELNLISQKRYMSEKDREEFIKRFETEEDLIGFVILGGIFSEGIDLVGENLIGALVVGVGLPMFDFKNNLIKDYFQKEGRSGYNYAYTYPGMNRVLQGVGRVIRRDTDKGAVLLIDDRYKQGNYKKLFPKEWNGYNTINRVEELKEVLNEFWNRGDGD